MDAVKAHQPIDLDPALRIQKSLGIGRTTAVIVLLIAGFIHHWDLNITVLIQAPAAICIILYVVDWTSSRTSRFLIATGQHERSVVDRTRNSRVCDRN